jgi:RNA polymerase sigma-70 factor (ECF subfamily)
MQSSPYSDEQFLEMFNGSEEERATVLRYFFSKAGLREIIVQKIVTMGGIKQDAENTFQKGFLLFNKALQKGNFKGEGSLKSYFIGICLKHWLSGLRKDYHKKTHFTNELPELDKEYQDSPEVSLLSEERKKVLRQALELLDENCRKIILWGNQSFRDQEIAKKLHFDSIDQVRKRRYRCMNKLREKLKDRPQLWQILKSFRYG